MLAFAKPNGFVGMITIPNWMFLSTFEDFANRFFDNRPSTRFITTGR